MRDANQLEWGRSDGGGSFERAGAGDVPAGDSGGRNQKRAQARTGSMGPGGLGCRLSRLERDGWSRQAGDTIAARWRAEAGQTGAVSCWMGTGKKSWGDEFRPFPMISNDFQSLLGKI